MSCDAQMVNEIASGVVAGMFVIGVTVILWKLIAIANAAMKGD